MIALSEEDRDSVRFYWVTEENGKIKLDQFKTLRFTRVPFGVTSSPFLLASTIKLHVEKNENVDPNVREALSSDLYVDDLCTGEENVEKAYSLSKGASELMLAAKMSLRKWETNSPELRKLWGENSASFPTQDQGTEIKVLGLNWNTNSDCFSFDLSKLETYLSDVKKTKRNVISAVAQIFDPVGVISPFVIRGKIIFQKLWRLKIGWDEELPLELSIEFETWQRELKDLNEIKLPRYYFHATRVRLEKLELHCFCDASNQAYGTVIYVRYVDIDQAIGVTFVTSKTKVAPLTEPKQTIPRLELMACLLGVRLTKSIEGTIDNKINKIFMWSDSTVALGWIRKIDKRWSPFVENRVTEIRKDSKIENWDHCPGIVNPADLASRGVSAKNLKNSQIWWEGPPFLKQPRENWPRLDNKSDLPPEAFSEERKTVLAVKCEIETGIHKIVDLNKYSSLRKVYRITAYVYRFLNKMRKIKNPKTLAILAEEFSSVETNWNKAIQGSEFAKEISQIKVNTELNSDSKIKPLSPFLDEDGVLRVGGRLTQSSLTHDSKHPIIFLKSSRFAKLLTEKAHEEVLHGGVSDTITQLRERYWLIAGRQLAKAVINKCLKCKRMMAKAGKVQTAPLPRDRIEQSEPFTIVGIDYCGPLYVKTFGETKETTKTYVCLYTCATTRALHLELVNSLTTDEFLLAFRRIVAKRGIPTIVYTDNALTFNKADLDLKTIYKSINSDRVRDFFGQKGIQWKFIVERAAWHGGMWERLVRSVKTTLKKVLSNALLNISEMTTVLAETEATINSRPISYVFNDAREPIPMSPSQFLVGKRICALPPSKFNQPNLNTKRQHLHERLKYRQTILDRLWTRWQREYLTQLRSAHHSDCVNSELKLKTGDVVLIRDDKLPRQSWKIGLVTESIEGRDGKIRSCFLRVSNGKIIKRAVQHLFNLEIQDA